MPATYPFDPTGQNVSNLVVDEQHVLTEVNSHPQRLLIPTFAPFSVYNLEVKYVDSLGNVTILVEEFDYYLCLPYVQATRSLGFVLYGGISINNLNLNGTIKVTYQTLGGDWIADPQYVLDRLAELVYNPRVTIWDIVTDKPNQFPPINHIEDMDYIYGHGDLINSINGISLAIGSTPNPNTPTLQHLINSNNPHSTTKDQIGLGFVANLPIASDNEIQTHSPANKYITLAQAILLLRSYGLIP